MNREEKLMNNMGLLLNEAFMRYPLLVPKVEQLQRTYMSTRGNPALFECLAPGLEAYVGVLRRCL